MICGICLEPLKAPVSTPCGHLHCGKCLTEFISRGEDAIRSSCPTCRTSFSIVTPNLAYIPQKYHEYIIPSIRRVYIDQAYINTLHSRIAELQERVLDLEEGKKSLQQKYQDCRASLKIATIEGKKVRREADSAWKEVESLREEVGEAQDDLVDVKQLAQESTEKLSNIVDGARSECAEIQRKYNSLKTKYSTLKSEREKEKANVTPEHAIKRKGSQSPELSQDFLLSVDPLARSVDTCSLQQEGPSRPMRALPKRAGTANLDPPPTFRKRPRLSAPALLVPQEHEKMPNSSPERLLLRRSSRVSAVASVSMNR